MNIPHTNNEIKEMLAAVSLSSSEALFQDIPESARLKKSLHLPPAMTEGELRKKFRGLSQKNFSLDDQIAFLGAGVYHHHIPSAISALISRGEFATAYTPYQAEASQGTLQAIFEFQTLMCRLTGMDVANASHYDGATSLAEAAFMAIDMTQRETILVSRSVHPHYRQVLQTYLSGKGVHVQEIEIQDGITSLAQAQSHLSSKVAALIVQYPNFFGLLEPLEKLAALCDNEGALLIAAVAEPVSLGILKPPGERGVSIVAGEGQSLGIPLSFGGPHVGYLAAKQKFIRRIPGRLVGETVDKKGKRAFTLTLQTREQHIRRYKAASNVCTNQSLCALANAVYMSLLGRKGFREASAQCYHKAHYASKRWLDAGLKPLFSSPFYHEFAVTVPSDVKSFVDFMQKEKILAGYSLEKDYPEYPNSLLLTVTEVNTRDEIDFLTQKIREFLRAGHSSELQCHSRESGNPGFALGKSV